MNSPYNYKNVQIHRDVDEFAKFHKLLMKNAPEGYKPFYFRCAPDGKEPYTKVGSWLENPLTLKEAVGWLKEGGNVGIAGLNEDPLVIVDIDDENVTDYKTRKKTLTARSGSRKGVHLYYFEDLIGSIPNIPTENAGEIRANNQYVIAPGSYVAGYKDKVENIGKYTVEVAEPSEKIALYDIPRVFRDQLEEDKKNRKIAETRKAKKRAEVKGEKTGKKSAFFDLTVYDIISSVSDPRERFPSVFHASKTGKNTSISNEGLIICWNHWRTLNAQQALCVLSGKLTCSEAGTGMKGRNQGVSLYTDNGEALFAAWNYAKENEYIPEDDPIPTGAMRYIAVNEGFCEEEDIKDGWKLPLNAYNKVLAYLKDNGIEPGREKGEPKGKKTKKTATREQQINDTAEIMEVLKQKYRFITAEDTKVIYYCKDGIFEEAATLIEAETEAHFNDTNSTYFTNEIINHLRRETYTNRDMFNADKTRIPLKNGLFNLETFALDPFDEDKIFTFRVPIVYDAKAECPNIEAWIKEIVNPDSLDLLQEFAGYGFEPQLPLHKTLWLHGSGRNGKGAFMRLYKKAIGRQNGSTIPLEQMSAKFRFVLIRLLDKLVNVCSEPQSNYVFQTETFKKITGGDEIEGEIKGLQKTVSFTSFAKLFIMGNRYPNIDDNTIGFWKRMEIVGFPNDYSDNFIPDIEDKKISADGGEEQALAGFFNWCMVGLKRLKEKNYKLSQSKSSEETRLEFEKVSNSIRAFITECVRLKPSEKYPKPALWNDYKDYCDRFDLQIQQKSIFTGRIGELRSVTLKPAKKDGKTQKFWFGLTFKGWEEDENAEEGEEVKDKKGLPKLSKLPDFNTTHGEDKNIKNIDNNIIGGYIQKVATLATLTTSTKEKPTPIEIKKIILEVGKCKECGKEEIYLIYVVHYSNDEFKNVCGDCGEQIMHDYNLKLSRGDNKIQ